MIAVISDGVDIFNGTAEEWTSARLSRRVMVWPQHRFLRRVWLFLQVALKVPI